MRTVFTILTLFCLNYLFAQCPTGYTAFNNLEFLSGSSSSGEVLNTAGNIDLSGGPVQFNTINDNTGAKLVTSNGDQNDFTLSGSNFAGNLGNTSTELNPSGATSRIRNSQGYSSAVSANNPGTISCNTFNVLFNSNILVTSASFNLSSLNTAGVAWEYSVIQMLDPSGSPFSPVSATGLTFTPGTANQYTIAGSGFSGQAGIGNFVSASTGTVSNVGSNQTTSGSSGPNDNLGSFSYGTVGLTGGTQIGGISVTTCLEDVRGTNNNSTNFTSSLLDFTISGCILNSTPAPVEFLKFNTLKENYNTFLSFSTASETNNDYFAIERSGDGRNFDAIGEIQGAGNSSEERHYEFTDENPIPGINYYRIKQTDFDGQYSYSEIRSVRHTGKGNVAISPRSTDGRLDISTEMESYDVAVYSSAGQEVSRFAALSGHQTVNIEALQAGVYFVKVMCGSESETVRVVKY